MLKLVFLVLAALLALAMAVPAPVPVAGPNPAPNPQLLYSAGYPAVAYASPYYFYG